ncbi:MAG: error-prone DNA polymerase [Burkholderiales bacterium]|nr:error-prone DNA polymerase [Burkholderiales bacterium]
MASPSPRASRLPAYAELLCRSSFSYLTGASQPAELVLQAQARGYGALALTDECSLAGVVRAWEAAQDLAKGAADTAGTEGCGSAGGAEGAASTGGTAGSEGSEGSEDPSGASDGGAVAAGAPALHFIVGALMQLSDEAAPAPGHTPHPHRASGAGARLVVHALDRRGYANLSRWITVARRRAAKGSYLAWPSDVEGKEPTAPHLAGLGGCAALLLVDGPEPAPGQPEAAPRPPLLEQLYAQAMWLKTWLGDRAGLGLALRHRRFDDERIAVARRLAQLTGLPIVAVGDVLMHARSRRALQDVLAATRLRCTVAQAGLRLESNAEAYLRPRSRLAELYEPAWLQAAVDWAARCRFSLAELRYEYPRELVPEGHTPASWLRVLAEQGAARRYPAGVPAEVRTQIEHELALIGRLHYEPYFLTVADLVHWARSQGILCQGRGSAANSTVCYCLHVTEVDPTRTQLLFERFVSAERNEPPDIDIDFEHQRREEVIQYIYRKYGRHRAAMTGVIISYRRKSALRDVGRALGFDLDRIEAVTKQQAWWDGGARFDPERLREHGFDPASPLVQQWAQLASQLRGFPRHLSQHPGGFVIAADDVTTLVPVENAAMAGRTVIQWDKDDLDALGLIKVDVLALGMLSAIRRGLAWVGSKLGEPPYPIQRLTEQQDDPAVFAMLSAADAVGVFQVESRAQLAMLPRLQPKCFYDLVVEVAIVRPGPIQGGMVHPYLRRRNGEEPVLYPSEDMRQALGRTLGVPIFQEQVMQLAMLAADFTPGEADQLRRAMAAWKRKGGLGPFHDKLVTRMVAKGYEREFAEAIFRQIEGFGEYGFPESHAASFALLVYVSAWLKRHHPDAFLAGLLNSQPMGFYAPAQLVRDARAHGVCVRPVDVMASDWESGLEGCPGASTGSARTGSCAVLPELVEGQGASRTGSCAVLPETGSCAVLPELVEGQSASRTGSCAVLPELVEGQGASRTGSRSVRPELVEGQGSVRTDGHATVADGVAAHSPPAHTLHPVRLGLSRLTGFREDAALRLMAARAEAPFTSVEDLARRAELDAHALRLLADGGALAALAGHRRQAAWAVAGVDTRSIPERSGAAVLRATRTDEPDEPQLAAPSLGAELLADYRRTGLSLTAHPLALLRPQLARFKVLTAAELAHCRDGQLARASGLVTHRQRPDTAKGVIFVTLEDETGPVNVVVWASVAEAQRTPLLAARLLTVYGVWQRQGAVTHLVAKKLVDHSALLRELDHTAPEFRGHSRDFH